MLYMCFSICRFPFYDVKYHQQMQPHSFSWHFSWGRNFIALHHRLCPSTRQVQCRQRAPFMVGTFMGEDPLLPWLQWKVLLPHRRLCFLHHGMWRWKCFPTRHARRVQPKQHQWIWFLSRQHLGWLQSPNDGWASSRQRRWWLHDNGLYDTLEQNVSVGAKSNNCGRLHWMSKCMPTIF
jgi:hypothetical protein